MLLSRLVMLPGSQFAKQVCIHVSPRAASIPATGRSSLAADRQTPCIVQLQYVDSGGLEAALVHRLLGMATHVICIGRRHAVAAWSGLAASEACSARAAWLCTRLSAFSFSSDAEADVSNDQGVRLPQRGLPAVANPFPHPPPSPLCPSLRFGQPAGVDPRQPHHPVDAGALVARLLPGHPPRRAVRAARSLALPRRRRRCPPVHLTQPNLPYFNPALR